MGKSRRTIQEEEGFTFITFLLLKKFHLYGLYLTGAFALYLRVEFGQKEALSAVTSRSEGLKSSEYILSVFALLGLNVAVSAFLSLR